MTMVPSRGALFTTEIFASADGSNADKANTAAAEKSSGRFKFMMDDVLLSPPPPLVGTRMFFGVFALSSIPIAQSTRRRIFGTAVHMVFPRAPSFFFATDRVFGVSAVALVFRLSAVAP